MRSPRTPERGSATVLVLGVCLVAFTMVTTVAGLGAAVSARHRAESAADLASLAAADVLLGRAGGAPCAAARRVATGDGASVLSCDVAGRQVRLRVAVRPGGWVGALGPATASARAGPARASDR